MNVWSEKSLKKLNTCEKDLITLANEVLKIHDCSVKQGHRTKEEQDEYFNHGTSKVEWPNSKHNSLPSKAIDLAPYKKGDSPYDMENVLFFAGIVIAVADRLYRNGLMTHKVRWGGNWSTKADDKFAFDEKNGFFDGIHFELKD